MSSVVLPTPPPQYDVRDQRELRRILMQFMRDMKRRVEALENA